MTQASLPMSGEGGRGGVGGGTGWATWSNLHKSSREGGSLVSPRRIHEISTVSSALTMPLFRGGASVQNQSGTIAGHLLRPAYTKLLQVQRIFFFLPSALKGKEKD